MEQIIKTERIRVYKEALNFIEKKETGYGLEWGSAGLCLLLPCIWLGLESFMNTFIDNEGNKFSMHEVGNYFPEFGKEHLLFKWENWESKTQWRTHILNKIISELQS